MGVINRDKIFYLIVKGIVPYTAIGINGLSISFLRDENFKSFQKILTVFIDNKY